MRLLNQDIDRASKSVTLYLTFAEAKELRDSLDCLLADPTQHHFHVADRSFEHEITVALYDPAKLNAFDERSQRLINDDE